MGIHCAGRRARALAIGVAAAGVVALTAGCGSGGSQGTSGSATAGGGAAASLAACGKGTKPASGAPITLGAIVTDVPGVDLTPVTDSTKAYFDCVNAHGGIDGRPIQYVVEHDQLNPQETSALASKLLNEDHVMGMVGNTSLIDCSVNGATYAKAGLSIIGAAIDNACFGLTGFASAALGPAYSAQLAAQYLIKQDGVKSLYGMATQAPGSETLNAGVVGLGKAAGLSVSTALVKVPVTDPNGTALSAADKAGGNGGVVLDLPPSELVKLLTAAGKQGLVDSTHWGCVNACTDSDLLKALGPVWNGKLVVPNEYPAIDAPTPDASLYRAVNAAYNSSAELSTFGQLGFVMGKIYADTLRQLPASALNRAGINRAIGAIHGYQTDMLCEPFSFDKGKPHVSVTAGRVFVPEDGKLKQVQGCTSLETVTPELRAAQAAG